MDGSMVFNTCSWRQGAPLPKTRFVGPPKSQSQMTSRSVQPFYRAHYCDRQTQRPTNKHATRSITIGRTYVLGCGLIVLSPHRAEIKAMTELISEYTRCSQFGNGGRGQGVPAETSPSARRCIKSYGRATGLLD